MSRVPGMLFHSQALATPTRVLPAAAPSTALPFNGANAAGGSFSSWHVFWRRPSMATVLRIRCPVWISEVFLYTHWGTPHRCPSTALPFKGDNATGFLCTGLFACLLAPPFNGDGAAAPLPRLYSIRHMAIAWSCQDVGSCGPFLQIQESPVRNTHF